MNKLIESQKYISAFKACTAAVHLIKKEIETEKQLNALIEYVIHFGKYFNHLSMQLLNGERSDDSQKLFGLILTFLKQFDGEEIHKLIGLTLNNLSCSFKRNGKIEEAQMCLQKALEFQERANLNSDGENDQSAKFEKSPQRNINSQFYEDLKSPDEINRAIVSPKQDKNEFALTELNLCAIYSQKGEHMRAKMYAYSSIYKLKQDLEFTEQKLLQEERKNEPDEKELAELEEKVREKQSLLAIAYYNLGCQQEHLKEWQKSMESYKRAVQMERTKLQKNGQQEQGLLDEFMRSYKDVKKKCDKGSRRQRIKKEIQKVTFSGLTKRQIDENSSQVSHVQNALRQNSYNNFTYKKGERDSQLSRQSISNKFIYQPSNAAMSKKRPMSAKNPMIQNRLNRNEISTPQLVGDDIINIQHEVINEEDYPINIEDDLQARNYKQFGIKNNHFQPLEQESKKFKRSRPVSSYVMKKHQEDILCSNSSKQLVPMLSNVVKANNVQSQALTLQQQELLPPENEMDATTFKSSTANLMMRPTHLPSLFPSEINQPSLHESRPNKLFKTRPQSTNTGQMTIQNSYKTSIQKPPKPEIPKPKSRVMNLSLSKQKTQKHLRNFNKDLPQSSQGDMLINYIDQNYQQIEQQDNLNRQNLVAKLSQTYNVSVENLYNQEILKQNEVIHNNQQLAKDIKKFSQNHVRILTAIRKNSLLQGNEHESRTTSGARTGGHRTKSRSKSGSKRNQPALKTQGSRVNKPIYEVHREETPISDFVEQNNMILATNFQSKAVWHSINKSSRKKLRTLKKDSVASIQIKKMRPHSAFPLKDLGKSQTRDEIYFPAAIESKTGVQKQMRNLTRVQSAGVQRIDSNINLRNKRERPQNKPGPTGLITGQISMSGLYEIDEHSGSIQDDETQIIYKQTLTNNNVRISDRESINSKDCLQIQNQLIKDSQNQEKKAKASLKGTKWTRQQPENKKMVLNSRQSLNTNPSNTAPKQSLVSGRQSITAKQSKAKISQEGDSHRMQRVVSEQIQINKKFSNKVMNSNRIKIQHNYEPFKFQNPPEPGTQEQSPIKTEDDYQESSLKVININVNPSGPNSKKVMQQNLCSFGDQQQIIHMSGDDYQTAMFDSNNNQKSDGLASLKWTLSQGGICEMEQTNRDDSNVPQSFSQQFYPQNAGFETGIQALAPKQLMQHIREEDLNLWTFKYLAPGVQTFAELTGSNKLEKLLTCQESSLRVPINFFDPACLDQARCDAICACDISSLIEFDQSVYICNESKGKFRLVFLLNFTELYLLVVLFKPTYMQSKQLIHAKIVRKLLLSEFGIKIGAQKSLDDHEVRETVVVGVIELIKQIKQSISGNYLVDFEHLGSAVPQDLIKNLAPIDLLDIAQLKKYRTYHNKLQQMFEFFSKSKLDHLHNPMLAWFNFVIKVHRIQRFYKLRMSRKQQQTPLARSKSYQGFSRAGYHPQPQVRAVTEASKAAAKIQRWWRKLKFTGRLHVNIIAGGKLGQRHSDARNIQVEINLLKDAQAKHSDQLNKRASSIDKLINIQKFWRSKSSQAPVPAVQQPNGDILHTQILEVIEGYGDKQKTSYKVTVERPNPKTPFMFQIKMHVNNRRNLVWQTLELPLWNVFQDETERVMYHQLGQQTYFKKLIQNRLFFYKYSPEEALRLRALAEERENLICNKDLLLPRDPTKYSLSYWIARLKGSSSSLVRNKVMNLGGYKVLSWREYDSQPVSPK